VPWRLTIRSGPRVARSRFSSLEEALDALQARGRELAEAAPRQTASTSGLGRRYAPVEQVIARLELAGPQRLSPSVQAGLDVRGDGSTEAFVGRLRRQVVESRQGEDSFATLGRAVRDRLS
jgi:hypothetical protein